MTNIVPNGLVWSLLIAKSDSDQSMLDSIFRSLYFMKIIERMCKHDFQKLINSIANVF